MKYTTPWCMHMALIIQFLLASMLVLPGAESSEYYRRAELIHVDANGGFTRGELIRRAAERAHLRAAMLSPADTQDEMLMVEATYSHFEYLMRLEVDDMAGKPQPFLAVADTGSNIIWMKKEMDQDPIEPVPCSCTSAKDEKLFAFTMRYGSVNKTAKGFICTHRKLRFLSPSETNSKTVAQKEIVDDISLGFAIHHDPHLMPRSAEGIVGLGRNEDLSLVYQLLGDNNAKFSYCLNNPLTDKTPPNSPFWFGGGPISDSNLKSTPLVDVSPDENPELYYVELLGISFDHDGEIKLPAKDYFKHKSQKGNGVMFIDSGCSHSLLEPPVFKELMKLLAGKLGNPNESITKDGKVQTCFPADDKAKKEPTLVLHFGGAQMRIPWGNYMLQDKPGSEFCLAIRQTAGVSVLGNIQQHNMYMHYDLTEKPGKLSFKEQVNDCKRP